MDKIQQFDMVSATREFSEAGIRPGQEGTVVDILPHAWPDGADAFEVEFNDCLGNSLHIHHFREEDLRVVWSSTTAFNSVTREPVAR